MWWRAAVAYVLSCGVGLVAACALLLVDVPSVGGAPGAQGVVRAAAAVGEPVCGAAAESEGRVPVARSGQHAGGQHRGVAWDRGRVPERVGGLRDWYGAFGRGAGGREGDRDSRVGGGEGAREARGQAPTTDREGRGGSRAWEGEVDEPRSVWGAVASGDRDVQQRVWLPAGLREREIRAQIG